MSGGESQQRQPLGQKKNSESSELTVEEGFGR
jgi:hypothetical protein